MANLFSAVFSPVATSLLWGTPSSDLSSSRQQSDIPRAQSSTPIVPRPSPGQTLVVLRSHSSDSDSSSSSSDEEARIRRRLRRERKKMRRLRKKMRKLEIGARRAEAQDRRTTVTQVARATAPMKCSGMAIGIFGQTSTGKSSVVNSLLGRQVAATGVGETTREMTPYQGRNYTLWDVPGRNDEFTYTYRQYIAFIKGLTRRVILIQYTIKENFELMKLLDNLKLDYYLVVNKFDDVESDERASFQRQIQREIRSIKLTRMIGLFFVSAKYPQMFRDWLTLTDVLTSPS